MHDTAGERGRRGRRATASQARPTRVLSPTGAGQSYGKWSVLWDPSLSGAKLGVASTGGREVNGRS
jgi:hypothetical protein